MATVSVSFQSTLINSANFFVAAIYDASSLGVVLETSIPTKGGGYTNPFQVTFLNSYNPSTIYRVILWENATAVVGGTSRVSASLRPTLNSATFRADEPLVYGIDAVFTDTVTIVDPSLIGWGISFEQYGSGTLTLGTDYTFDNTTGTIVLINGTSYVNGQKMVIHFLPQISTAPSSYSGIATGSVVSVSTTMGSGYANSAVYLQGSGGSFIMTLPALSTMADYQPIEFYSAGGNHINVVLLCSGSDKIQWNVLKTKLILGQAEEVTLFKANGVWNVKNPSASIRMAGEIVYKYTNADFPYVLADGSSGGLLSRATYSRLFDYVQGLPIAAVTTEAAWANSSVQDGITYYPNKGTWTMGDGSTNFRVPLLINQFIRGADGSARQPGSLQVDAMLDHQHPFLMGGVGGSYPNGKGPLGTSGGDTGAYTLNQDMTDHPYNDPGPGVLATVLSRVATENRPVNISLFALIRI